MKFIVLGGSPKGTKSMLIRGFRSMGCPVPLMEAIRRLSAGCIGIMLLAPLCLALGPEDTTNQLVVCMHETIHKLDPAAHRSRTIPIILKNMLDSLTTRDASLKVVPQLAESWQRLDETSWEFRLRKGVKFHNHDELTAEDVQFSLQRIIQEGGLEGITSPRQSLLAPVEDVAIKDRYTVVIKTKKPWPILPLMLSLQEIVPKNHMTRVGSAAFQAHPIGTGPFKFVGLEKDRRIVMQRFEDYYGGSPAIPPVQKAPLASLVFEYVPLRAEQIRMLKKKECDIIVDVAAAALPILRASDDIEILSSPATRSYFAEINCRKPPFDNPRIRQALNYGVDIDTVVHQILGGNGIVLPTVLLPNAEGYNDDLRPYGYDPARAERMLSEADFDFDTVVQIHCTKDHLQFANNLNSFLSRIGVKSRISVVKFRKPDMFGAAAPWDLFLGAWGNSTLDPVGIILPKFRSNGRGNYSGYANPAVDRLMDQAEGMADAASRIACYRRIQELVHADAPMIFGYAKIEYYGVNKRVKNFLPTSAGMMNMHDVFIETGSDR